MSNRAINLQFRLSELRKEALIDIETAVRAAGRIDFQVDEESDNYDFTFINEGVVKGYMVSSLEIVHNQVEIVGIDGDAVRYRIDELSTLDLIDILYLIENR